MYALPHAYYDKYRVRKYGFHGTSHKYVAQTGARLAGLDFENSKIITCHIGNGASVTAVLNGKSHDTSMGFSPVDGLVMGTRCGNVDPSAVTFIGEKEGMSYAEENEMMNKKSGVWGSPTFRATCATSTTPTTKGTPAPSSPATCTTGASANSSGSMPPKWAAST